MAVTIQTLNTPALSNSLSPQNRGVFSSMRGVLGEQLAWEAYSRTGAKKMFSRWRGGGGEIDLILLAQEVLVFVEVKYARNIHEAAPRISSQKARRLERAFYAFIAAHPEFSNYDMRFDVVLADSSGRVEILNNVFISDQYSSVA